MSGGAQFTACWPQDHFGWLICVSLRGNSPQGRWRRRGTAGVSLLTCTDILITDHIIIALFINIANSHADKLLVATCEIFAYPARTFRTDFHSSIKSYCSLRWAEANASGRDPRVRIIARPL